MTDETEPILCWRCAKTIDVIRVTSTDGSVFCTYTCCLKWIYGEEHGS